MTREDAKKAAEVMMAYAEGKKIEYRVRGGEEWRPISELESPQFGWNSKEYRIKPEITYRPFKDKDECWEEMQKHQPFGWVKRKEDGCFSCVIAVDDTKWYDDVYKTYTFVDGTPFGIKEERK